MEASPIPNLAPASQAPLPSAGPTMSAKSGDTESVPPFAQVVREILVRTKTQSDTQPAHTLQSGSPAKTGKQGTLSAASLQSVPAGSLQSPNVQALNAVSLASQCALMLPAAPTSPAPEAASCNLNSTSPETIAPSSADLAPISQPISKPMIPPQTIPIPVGGSATNQVQLPVASVAPTESHDQSFMASNQLTAIGAPDSSTPQNDKNLAAANQLPAFALPDVDQSAAVPASQQPVSGVPDASSVVGGSKLASALQVSLPSLRAALPAPTDAKAAAVGQFSPPAYPVPPSSASSKDISVDSQKANAINQAGDPSSLKTITDGQALVDKSGSSSGTALSNLPPQNSPWQTGASLNSSAASGGSTIVAHVTPTQAAPKPALYATQLASELPAVVPQVSNVKNVPIAPTALPIAVPPANAPSSNRSGSQESSSNTGAQKSIDTSATPSSPVSRDATAFSQVLATASDAKPQAVPAAGIQAPVIQAATLPLNDHPATPAAVSLPAAPGNPPDAASRMFDAVPSPTVSDAQISQNSNHSEMRIAMQTDKLGAVELHARVSGDEVGAAITVEKRDAHAALAVELPSLQQALSDKQFRVDQITLLHGSLHSTRGDGGGQAQAQQGDRGTHRVQVAQSFLRDHSGAFISFQPVTENRDIFDSQGRLSVQA